MLRNVFEGPAATQGILFYAICTNLPCNVCAVLCAFSISIILTLRIINVIIKSKIRKGSAGYEEINTGCSKGNIRR
jgi:hypothetical protein